jgi:hypothetical protein
VLGGGDREGVLSVQFLLARALVERAAIAAQLADGLSLAVELEHPEV